MVVRVLMHNIRSTYNVGAILRTCEGLGVSQVVLSGFTPRYQDARLLPHLRNKLDRQITKTALGAEKLVDIYTSDDIYQDLQSWQREGWQLLGLENNLQDERLLTLDIAMDRANFKEKVILVLGEELSGIDPKLRELMDNFLEIPMQGQKESFNVAVAAGIALHVLRSRFLN